MWQGTERQINLREIDIFNPHQHWQIQMPQVRKHLPHALPRFAIRRQSHDFHATMASNKAHQFGTGISAGTENRDFMGLAHDLYLYDYLRLTSKRPRNQSRSYKCQRMA